MASLEKLRSEIEDKYKWDLTSMYKNEEEYEKDFNELKKLIDEVKKYKGILTKDANTLLEFLKLDDKIDILTTNLFVYACSKKDEDVANEENSKRYKEILGLYSLLGEEMSFVTPELLKTDYSIIKDYLKENKELKEYAFDLELIYKYQPFVLSENEEKLLNNISDLQNKFENNFDLIINSIIDYGYIKDEDGNEVKLTNGNYIKYAKSSNRNVRKDAFYARMEGLRKLVNLIATDYEAYIKADSYIAKAKGYNSNLHMYLFPDGITKEVYNNLLSVADKNLNVLYKYYDMIKKVLKQDELYVYDISAPLTKTSNKKYTPDDAKKIIIDALSIYGDEYISVLNKAFDERWIDFYPNKGKRSGYYQNDSFKGNPIVLANYTDDYTSVSSLAHELGHALHSYYSKKNNKEHLSKYSILVAEIASLTNEILLSNYVIKNSNDKEEKLNAINNILEVFSGNFFGTLCEGSVFEKEVHEKVFNGEVLTVNDFNDIFEKIKVKSYGPDVKDSNLTKYNWARIPHFYTPFYYYKYSLGIIGACYVARKILSGDKEYLEKYINFLKLGGSMMPLDELKTIDLDFTKEEKINDAIKYFDELIDEFINIYNS